MVYILPIEWLYMSPIPPILREPETAIDWMLENVFSHWRMVKYEECLSAHISESSQKSSYDEIYCVTAWSRLDILFFKANLSLSLSWWMNHYNLYTAIEFRSDCWFWGPHFVNTYSTQKRGTRARFRGPTSVTLVLGVYPKPELELNFVSVGRIQLLENSIGIYRSLYSMISPSLLLRFPKRWKDPYPNAAHRFSYVFS